ncbi:MAG: HAD hydrolase family protein [Nitrospiraceae bacterium]|nr:HAD hydrolase family protein [Nitrospiraceae bacterium]
MQDLQQKLRPISFIVCDVDGVLTDGRMWFDGEGRPFRCLHARDGTALTLWHLAGHQSAIVSGLGCRAVEAIADQWRCAECHMWIKDKGRICEEIAERHGIPLDAMAFLGDDIIDRSAIRVVGLGVAVSDAMPELKAEADLTLESHGGAGAVRELVHKLLKAQGRLDETIERYCNRKDHAQ